MCGIAGIHRRTDALTPSMGKLVNQLLLAVANRGSDATGLLAMLDDGKVTLQKEIVSASRFVERRQVIRSDSRTVLLHTRMATVGVVEDLRNAHPVINGNFAAVHNGTIYNHRELFHAFGLRRHGSVDSEIIPAILNEAGWEHAAQAFDLLDGGAAFAVVTDLHPGELVLARTRSYPLHYYVTRDLVVWASTERAIRQAWQRTYGRAPRGGSWVQMEPWQMVLVNGDLTTVPIRETPPPARPPKRRSVPATDYPRRGPAPRTAAPVAAQLTMEREPWMDDAVRDLQRIQGMSYAAAYDAVYGVAPDDDADDWISALLDDSERDEEARLSEFSR